jgi:hypothetical protein
MNLNLALVIQRLYQSLRLEYVHEARHHVEQGILDPEKSFYDEEAATSCVKISFVNAAILYFGCNALHKANINAVLPTFKYWHKVHIPDPTGLY